MEPPTNNDLLECVTRYAVQYLCEDLGPLIAKYARACLEIITQDGTMYFDDETRTWMCMPFNQKPQTDNLAKLNGTIYAVGGSNFDDDLCVKYYDTTHHWTRAASMHITRYSHRVGVLNCKLYAVGGLNESNKGLRSAECYDDIKDQWTTLASMNTARQGFGLGVLNGKLYAVGGYDDNTGETLSSVECYDPISNQWSTVASMNIERQWHGVCVLNNKLYAVGGLGGDDVFEVSSVECYDDVGKQWTPVASMSIARYSPQVRVFNGKIYAVGGHDSTGASSSVECYGDGSDTWTVVPDMTIDEKYRGFVP